MLLLPVAVSAVAEHPGEVAYKACAACHLPSGDGVAGVFPPVADRVEHIAATDAGREYLVAVVSAGLMGPIQVDGTSYVGIMPGSGAALGAEQIADVLNYIAQELGEEVAEEFQPFTLEEVEEILGDAEFDISSNNALRAQLAEEIEALR